MAILDWIQALSMVLLIIVTGIYAWRTFAISKSTEKQACASKTMAVEMKAQRLTVLQPRQIKR